VFDLFGSVCVLVAVGISVTQGIGVILRSNGEGNFLPEVLRMHFCGHISCQLPSYPEMLVVYNHKLNWYLKVTDHNIMV
jgi:hypothetical protein